LQTDRALAESECTSPEAGATAGFFKTTWWPEAEATAGLLKTTWSPEAEAADGFLKIALSPEADTRFETGLAT
jgi:hypothetical protein